MRILSRYFFASYLSLFVVVLFVSLTVIALIEMLVHFDELVEHREEVGGVLAYLLIRVPSIYLRQLIPVASFTAAFLCLGLAARRQEIIALKSGGIPTSRVAAPVLIASILLSGAALFVNETLLLGATREFTRLEHPGQPVVFGDGFPRPDRRAKFTPAQVTPPDDLPDSEYPMILITGRLMFPII